jgi:ribose transport system substrate-binding protein
VISGIIIILSVLTLLSIVFYNTLTARFNTKDNENAKNCSCHYAFIGNTSSSLDNMIYEAAYKEGLEKNAYVEYMGRNLDVSYTKVQLMDIAIDAKVDGIILDGDETEDLTRAIYEASLNNIPVITAGTDCSGSARQSYVGISYYTLGQEYGRRIARSVSDKKQTVLVLMSPNAKNQDQNIIYSGLRDYLTKINVQNKFSVSTQAVGDGTIFSAEEDISDIFGDKTLPDIMVCLDETDTTCACQAIVDYNRVGDTMLLGYYRNDTIIDAIRKDILSCSFTVDSSEIGIDCVNELNDYKSDGRITEYLTIGIQKIDSSNVERFADEEDNSNEKDY